MSESAVSEPPVSAHTPPQPEPSGAPKPATFQQPFRDAYADLENMIAAGEEGAAGAESGKPSKQTKPARPAKSQDAPAKQEAEQGKQRSAEDKAGDGEPDKPDEGKPGSEAPPGKTRAAELRSAYESLKAKYKALEEEHRKLKSQPPPKDPEKEEMAKRLAELEHEMRFRHYESSEEYKQQYEKPFVEAYQQGRAKAASLKVTDESGDIRQGTPEDFDRIVRLADDDAAADLAAELFGNKAPVILYHRERVHELNAARVKAIEEFRKLGGERDKKLAEEQSRAREEIARLWRQANADAAEKYPQWFKPAEGADDENQALEAGYQMADRGFSDDPSMTIEERVALHSAIRNRAAAFGRVVLQNRKLAARVAELERELQQFKSSEPGSGGGKGLQKQELADTLDAVVAGLDSLAK